MRRLRCTTGSVGLSLAVRSRENGPAIERHRTEAAGRKDVGFT
jgi:hypothetical protein